MNFKIMLIMCMVFLSVGTVSAFEFDNVKSYNEELKVVTITNALGLGDVIGQAKLTSSQNVRVARGYQKVAEFEIWAYQDYNDALKQFEFIDMKHKTKINRNYDMKILSYEIIEVEDYYLDCSNSYFVEGMEFGCTNIFNGTHEEIREIWTKVTPADLKKNDKVTIGIFTDVLKNDYVDWIPTIYGVQVDEWATWEESWSVNLSVAYPLDETSGNAIDSVYGLTGIVEGATQNVAGHTGTAYSFTTNDYVNLTDQVDVADAPFSVNIWVNPDVLSYPDAFAGAGISAGAGCWAFYLDNEGDLAFGVRGFPEIRTDNTGRLVTGTWAMVTAIYRADNTVDLYINGSLILENEPYTDTLSCSYDYVIGSGSSGYFNGDIDNFMFWDRELSHTEVSDIYDNHAGSVYSTGTPPSVTLVTPINYENLTSINVNFNVTVTDDQKVDNVTLYVDGAVEEVKTTNVNGTYLFSRTLTEAYHNWSILAYDNASLSNQSETRFFNITILAPTIELYEPADNIYITSLSDTFIGKVYDDSAVVNVSLLIDGSIVQTNTSGINNTNYTFTYTFPSDNTYTWAFKSCDNSGDCSTSTRTITADTTTPLIFLNSFTNVTTYSLPIYKNINVSMIDDNPEVCKYWLSDNSTNVTVTCSTNNNQSFNSGGNKIVYAWVNDTVSFTNSTNKNFFINYVIENVTYDNPTIEGDTQTIYLNITATEIQSLSANLTWNGVTTAGTISNNGTYGLASVTFDNPSATTVTFNWTYNLNGNIVTTQTYNQSVNLLTPINVTTAECSDKALIFILQDEGNLTNLTGSIDYNFQYGPSNNNTLKKAFGTITNASYFYVCINATSSPFYNVGYGELHYSVDSYVDRRYYLFEDSRISNETFTTHYLKNLLSADQTSFLLTMEDTSLNVYSEKYTALWRWYPDLNDYQIVEMGKTDEDGQTVAHVRTEDVDYRVGLYERNGILIKLDNPRRFVCTSSPCSLTIRVGAGDVDYSSIFDVQTSLKYNQTTKVFTLIYNDPNQLTSSMRLVVTRETGTSVLTLCNTSTSGFSGVISCNTSAYNGLKRAVVYRSASPPVIVAQKVVNQLNTTFNSGFGLFISIILWLAIVLSGFGNNPVWTLILSVVGLIPALMLGSINIAIFTGIAVLGAIIIHFIKRTVAR